MPQRDFIISRNPLGEPAQADDLMRHLGQGAMVDPTSTI
jgi:hypothetical protein